ncbi:hypothetical protein FA09DRAFT_11648 [Tilletiopsis washingtonensis]|jgi:hypothetical protein|uniref:Uncharacterized protein n=1 Tax=Tilletiopsis washingtonensis TaxID=58919 RepID=A0A316ZJT6_9BASI|nr:hypothetical protein FA09DRAFT_11648 [Tilletiopsis washingtonensis]PWO01355.1 hypothetical protein FA09DRAFT_11648 [Tilletiopsis washingtonensis]
MSRPSVHLKPCGGERASQRAIMLAAPGARGARPIEDPAIRPLRLPMAQVLRRLSPRERRDASLSSCMKRCDASEAAVRGQDGMLGRSARADLGLMTHRRPRAPSFLSPRPCRRLLCWPACPAPRAPQAQDRRRRPRPTATSAAGARCGESIFSMQRHPSCLLDVRVAA